MTHGSTPCPSCGAPLESDKVCLACLFEEAREAKDSRFGEGEGSHFGDYAPPSAGIFGKYILRQKLGEGGMGVIWEAMDTTLQRVVALKMIRGFAFSSDTERQRFQAEASAVARLDHPNIVPIYEVGEIDEQPYFTMKLLRGGTLSQSLLGGPLGAREGAVIMEKLARAVQHAHERGVLHRDLKPDNVLFDEVGEPYLTDFGLAKLLNEATGLTRTQAQIGTPQYMSPEQARGRAVDITAASDVWSAGALLYNMISGKIPFPGESSGEILDRVAREAPLPMEPSPDASVDEELETLCLRCLEKDTGQRLASAGFLADELGRWLAGEPIQTKSLRARPATSKPWRVVALGTVGCLLAIAAFQSGSRDDAPPQKEVPPVAAELAAPSEGIDLKQTFRVEDVFLDATKGLEQAGAWIQPGDAIELITEGGYTFGEDDRIWSWAGDVESGSPAGDTFAFPDCAPWALVGVVRSADGTMSHFPVADKVDYSGEVSGELLFAINTPEAKRGRSGGFDIIVEVLRQSRIFSAGTDAAEAWGAPIVQPDSYLGLRIDMTGMVKYSEDAGFLPAGQVSGPGRDGLLAPHLDEHAIIARIGEADAFVLHEGHQRFYDYPPGWLQISVNDEIARAGAFADNQGSLEVKVDVFRPYRALTRRIEQREVKMWPLSVGTDPNGTPPSFDLRTRDFEAEAQRRGQPTVFLHQGPAIDFTKLDITAITVGPNIYTFLVKNLPTPPEVEASRTFPYLAVEDANTVQIRWGPDLYTRALFERREALAREPGAGPAYSFQSRFIANQPDWPEELFLIVDPDGRLAVRAPDGTEAFNRAATWEMKLEKQLVKFGDSIGLRNEANLEYLDTCGFMADSPLGALYPAQMLHVFTSQTLNRWGRPSGTWKIEPPGEKPMGAPLCYGDAILLRNEYHPNAGWLDGFAPLKDLSLFRELEMIEGQQSLVSTARGNKDPDKSHHWIILDDLGHASGKQVEIGDQIILRNGFGGGEAGFLNAKGPANIIPVFGGTSFTGASSFVFVRQPGEPREGDLWKVVSPKP